MAYIKCQRDKNIYITDYAFHHYHSPYFDISRRRVDSILIAPLKPEFEDLIEGRMIRCQVDLKVLKKKE